jgi:hypothetical protein
MTRHSSAKPFVLATLLFTIGCEGLTIPAGETAIASDRLTVVRVAPDAPPLLAEEVSFWIVRGEQREVQLSYAVENGYNAKCLRLVVPADAPLRHADGRVFAPGDSALVTVRILDPGQFLFEFDAGGVQLNPASPAYMEVRYRWIAEDVNGDGVVDAEDERIAASFGIWARTGSADRWTTVSSVRDGAIAEIRAPVASFTRYALAAD